jgi:hypothetical protein
MTIKRSGIGTIDFNDEEFKEDDEEIYYCRHCLSYGFKVQLRNRIYPDNEPIPVDHSSWRQCHECGLIVPVYELEKEASIKDVIETVDNPFDVGTSFLGIDKRTSVGGKNAGKKRDRQKELDEIKEMDLKAELAKGHTLLSYSEQMPQ